MTIDDCVLEVLLNSLQDDASSNSILNDLTDGLNDEKLQMMINEIEKNKEM